MNRYSILVSMVCVCMLAGCDNDSTSERIKLDSDEDYIVFGTYYGFCHGESCIETFAVQNHTLYEDVNDVYAPADKDFKFQELSADKYELVKNIFNDIPSDLLVNESATLGCPDCADGGGVYLEIKTSTLNRTYYIDNVKTNIPEYLHSLVDEVHAKVASLQ